MLDILAFGAHPDDVEIGVGGTLALHASYGYRLGIVDLTRGEKGSNGTVEERAYESSEGGRVLGVEVRDNAGLPDAYLRPDQEALKRVVELIRRHQPKLVLAPFYRDRHPDHGYAGQLVKEACHLSGLKKFPAGGTPYRPNKLYYYFLANTEEPQLIVDISSHVDIKWRAIACHKSQFSLPPDGGVKTLVNSPLFVRHIRGRDQFFGAQIGVEYGEGFLKEGKLAVSDLLGLGER